MNLQESIRRILREETEFSRGKTYLLRRVSGEVIEENFNMCLRKAEEVYLRHIKKWKNYTLKKYKDFVIGMLIDELHFKITNGGEDVDSQIFEEIYDFLMNVYSEQITESYNVITKYQTINEQTSSKDKIKGLIHSLGIPAASKMVGGTQNLVKLGYDGDIIEYAKDNDIKLVQIKGEPPSMYIDDSLIQKLDLPDFGKDEKNLGSFKFGPHGKGENFLIYVRVIKNTYSYDRVFWKVAGIRGSMGFGYWYIVKKEVLGKKIRLQIYKQIIEKYNLQQYM